MKSILITGSSGFIGYHTAKKLLSLGYQVIGIDNENNYYSPKLKGARRKELESSENFHFHLISIEHTTDLEKIFDLYSIDTIINLAAQPWVRYSLINPYAYIQSNIVWFHNILEIARKYKIPKVIYASSSSVYWNSNKLAFSIEDNVDHPISLYAATKKSNELIAHAYSHLFGISTIGLRFFTVYGPYGRPDMAIFWFTDKIIHEQEISVFNFWKMKRDFTYIDDIVNGIIKALDYETNYDIFNLWSDNPVQLERVIELIEHNLWVKAKKKYLPMQDGDVVQTSADISFSREKLNWHPQYTIEQWIHEFVKRYQTFYQ